MQELKEVQKSLDRAYENFSYVVDPELIDCCIYELNAGQMIEDVRLAVNGKIKVEHFGRLGGIVPDPDEIVTALEEKIIK